MGFLSENISIHLHDLCCVAFSLCFESKMERRLVTSCDILRRSCRCTDAVFTEDNCVRIEIEPHRDHIADAVLRKYGVHAVLGVILAKRVVDASVNRVGVRQVRRGNDAESDRIGLFFDTEYRLMYTYSIIFASYVIIVSCAGMLKRNSRR